MGLYLQNQDAVECQYIAAEQHLDIAYTPHSIPLQIRYLTPLVLLAKQFAVYFPLKEERC